MRNIAKKFKMTMSLIDIETISPRYKCFFGEDVELCIKVIDEDKKPLDLTDVNAKVYYTCDKFEPLRQDNNITINKPATDGTINILVNKKYLRLGVNTIRVALFDSDQEVLLQPCQVNCIETGIGDEHGDVIVNDDINVKDEFIKTNNKVNGIDGRLKIVEGDVPEIKRGLADVNEQLDNKAKQLDKKIDEVAQSGTTIETVQNKITEMAQNGSITFNTVTPNMTTFATVSANLFDKDDVEIEKGKFINSLGNFTTASGYNISGYIKAKANDKFTHRFNPSLSGKDATFIYYDENKSKLGYARGVLSKDESTCTITVPNNPSIRSIRVTFTDPQKLEFMLVSGEVYPNKYIRYGEIEFNEKVVFSDIQKSNIKDLSLKAIEEIPIKPNQTDFFITSKNLFNKNDGDIQVGKFINANGGISSAKGYNISGFIDVVEEQQYIYKFNKSQLGTNATYLYYGDSDNLLGSAKGIISEDWLTCSLTAPIGAKKIKINFIETDKNSLMFVKGNDYPSKYEEYGIIKFVESIGLNDKQKEEVRELGSSNPLEGKIISGNGDSIMYGAGYVGGFLKIIAERNNMIYENIAVSGATITQGIVDSNTSKNRHWISATINNMRNDADYVLLEGGVNDASQSVPVPLGSITEGYTSSLDVNTFCGAFESMLKQALERFPGKKIGFVLVHKMCDGFNSSKPKNYYHYAIEILEKWGIPYVDLNTKCPPLNYINSLKTVYTNNGDGWHPNELGYKKYYCDKIEQFLISL